MWSCHDYPRGKAYFVCVIGLRKNHPHKLHMYDKLTEKMLDDFFQAKICKKVLDSFPSTVQCFIIALWFYDISYTSVLHLIPFPFNKLKRNFMWLMNFFIIL